MSKDSKGQSEAFMGDLVLGEVQSDSHEKVWYISVDAKQYGPYTYADINSQIQQGKLTFQDYIFKEGMENWAQIGELPIFGSRNLADQQVTPPSNAKIPEAPGAGMEEWYVYLKDSDSQLGPFPIVEVKAKLSSREFSYEDYIWHEGFGSDWKKIADVPEFNRRTTPPPGIKKKGPPMPPKVGMEKFVGDTISTDMLEEKNIPLGNMPQQGKLAEQNIGAGTIEVQEFSATDIGTNFDEPLELKEGVDFTQDNLLDESKAKVQLQGQNNAENLTAAGAGAFEMAPEGQNAGKINKDIKIGIETETNEKKNAEQKTTPDVDNAKNEYESVTKTRPLVEEIKVEEEEEEEEFIEYDTDTSFSGDEFTESIEGETSCSLVNIDSRDVKEEKSSKINPTTTSKKVKKKLPKKKKTPKQKRRILAVGLLLIVLAGAYFNKNIILSFVENPDKILSKLPLQELWNQFFIDEKAGLKAALKTTGQSKGIKGKNNNAEEKAGITESGKRESFPLGKVSKEKVEKFKHLKTLRQRDKYITDLMKKNRDLASPTILTLLQESRKYKTISHDIMFAQIKVLEDFKSIKQNTIYLRKLIKKNRASFKVFSKKKVCLDIAEKYKSLNKPGNALRWYKLALKFIKNKKERANLYASLGDLYDGLSRHKAAASNYKKAIKYGAGEEINIKLQKSLKMSSKKN